ncbi:MAG TPA: hypothetical protein VGP14_06165 [Casimicrobiaceae bacterium]|jgi:hypothetical protein|nr:hypothetical protein [Casimicrobiaceae bacterium]
MNRQWLHAWVAALLVCALLAVGYEWLLRQRGYLVTVQDDADLWSIQLDRIRNSPRAVALLGASRIEFGVDPELLSHELGGRPVAMLAVNGRYPLAALRELADDRSFIGLAIVGVDARGMQRRHWEMQQSYFDHYRRRWTLSRWIHRKLLTALQENLVFVRSAFSAINIVERWIAGEGPPMNDHVVVRADRAGFIDYHRPDLPGIRASRVAELVRYYREEPPTDSRTWLHDLDAASAWVEKIQRRGGRVVFFREPAADESLALDEANFPRDRYWDAYARRSPATMIDFRDVPEMTAFVLPDTSHIDGTDVPRFTIALANLLKSRKLVD